MIHIHTTTEEKTFYKFLRKQVYYLNISSNNSVEDNEDNFSTFWDLERQLGLRGVI